MTGLVMMAIIMFPSGLELVGITAAEATTTRSKASKATNQVIYPNSDLLCGFTGRSALAAAWTRVTAETPARSSYLPRTGQYLHGECTQYRRADGGAFRLQQLRVLQQPLLFGLRSRVTPALLNVDSAACRVQYHHCFGYRGGALRAD